MLTQMNFKLLSEEAKGGKYYLLLKKAVNFALGLGVIGYFAYSRKLLTFLMKASNSVLGVPAKWIIKSP